MSEATLLAPAGNVVGMFGQAVMLLNTYPLPPGVNPIVIVVEPMTAIQ